MKMDGYASINRQRNDFLDWMVYNGKTLWTNGWFAGFGGSPMLGSSHTMGYSWDINGILMGYVSIPLYESAPNRNRACFLITTCWNQQLLLFQKCVGSSFTYFAWIKLIICISDTWSILDYIWSMSLTVQMCTVDYQFLRIVMVFSSSRATSKVYSPISWAKPQCGKPW